MNLRFATGLALGMAACARSPSGTISPERPVSLEIDVAAPAPAAPAPSFAVPAPRPASVVELFTSEGCSSCPPADQNLAEITDAAARSGQRVFTLERHVDYWDDLGWKDPFSAPGHSEAQRRYAARFDQSSVYTPQMIVNGREQFIGSERKTARDAVLRGLALEPALGVAVVANTTGPHTVRVEYRVGGKGAVNVALALLEDSAETSVKRGENAHRMLRHRHVVRAFATRELSAPGAGSWSATWPSDASLANRTALVYVSDRESLAVLGAASANVD